MKKKTSSTKSGSQYDKTDVVKWSILSFALAVLLCFGLYKAITPKNTTPDIPKSSTITHTNDTSRPSEEVTKIPTEELNWKTYKSDEAGYSVQYPQDWVVDIKSGDDAATNWIEQAVFTDDNDTERTYKFYIAVERDRPYKEVVQRLGGGDAGYAANVIKEEQMTVGGLPATKATIEYSELDFYDKDMNWKVTGTGTVIVVDSKNPILIVKGDDTNENIFNQVLSTITFN